MKVTGKMTMRDYDAWTRQNLPNKIPDLNNRDRRRRKGDSLYDFSTDSPRQREGVHRLENMATDLGGGFVLLSTEFYYFGDRPVPLPTELLPIVKQGRSHQSKLNAPYLNRFVEWIYSLGIPSSTLVGKPQRELADDKLHGSISTESHNVKCN